MNLFDLLNTPVIFFAMLMKVYVDLNQ
jgi:hypothetical protein